MKCIKCQEEIPPLRLEAVPGTKTCVQCSSTSRWYVRNVISGKTTNHESQLLKDLNVGKEMDGMERGKGWGGNWIKVRR